VQLNAETLPIIAALLAVPAAVFLLLYFLTGRRAVLAGIVTALAGAAAGAFLASAGSAMATAVDPNAAMLRGGLVGFAGSAAVALVVGLLMRLVAAGRKRS
jgi:hypothetical protein